jgi:histo-blood group ABO system transferase
MVVFNRLVKTCIVLFIAAGYIYLAVTPSKPVKQCQKACNVGLCIVATGRYIQFARPLIDSAEKYFLPGHNRTYYVFTDHLDQVPSDKNVVGIYYKKIGWPYDTLLRCSAYHNNQSFFEKEEYLFACDADLLFVDTVGDEVLGKLVATLHPGFVDKRGTYDTNSQSTACVQKHEGTHYFAGAFYGGQKNEFIKIATTMLNNIKKDQEKNVMALWHDESHLNRYFIDNKPEVILSPSYCFPQGSYLAYQPRLMALNKNHSQVRA